MKLERQFAKELAPDLRKETAEKLKAARRQPTDYDNLKKEFSGKIPSEYEQFYGFQENAERMKKDIFGKIFKTEKYKERLAYFKETLAIKKEYEIKNAKRDYDTKLKEIMRDCPLSEEERDKYLTTEVIEKMPLDEYLVLLERLSGEAFYHVTRYGVRENTFMSTGGGHTVGEGDFVDNFTPLLKDGYINSATSTILKSKELSINEEVVSNLFKSGKTVDEIVDKVMTEYGSDYFLDSESAHFSYGKDFHHMYGAENNYKFYLYYPVEYILHNDFYQKSREAIKIGEGYINNRYGISQQYNDFEIFNFGKGVSTKAGLLCVSADVAVDPETGSQYLLNNGQPQLDENGEFKKPPKTISSREYWEKYLKEHPELGLNKVIYGNFGTWTDKEDENLQNLADKKNIYKQDEAKTQEFKDYEKMTREEVGLIVRKKIEDICR